MPFLNSPYLHTRGPHCLRLSAFCAPRQRKPSSPLWYCACELRRANRERPAAHMPTARVSALQSPQPYRVFPGVVRVGIPRAQASDEDDYLDDLEKRVCCELAFAPQRIWGTIVKPPGHRVSDCRCCPEAPEKTGGFSANTFVRSVSRAVAAPTAIPTRRSGESARNAHLPAQHPESFSRSVRAARLSWVHCPARPAPLGVATSAGQGSSSC
jgi:hypothetical protein